MRISDWSSDVCSSDLDRKRMSVPPDASAPSCSALTVLIETGTSCTFSTPRCAVTSTASRVAACFPASSSSPAAVAIGRAPCRERACTTGSILVVAVALQQQNYPDNHPYQPKQQ